MRHGDWDTRDSEREIVRHVSLLTLIKKCSDVMNFNELESEHLTITWHRRTHRNHGDVAQMFVIDLSDFNPGRLSVLDGLLLSC